MPSFFTKEQPKKQEDNNWTHPEDDLLNASPKDYESFIDSPLWRDMEQTIDDRIEIMTSMLVSVDNVQELKEIQSEIQTLRDMKELPEYLMHHAEMEQEIENED